MEYLLFGLILTVAVAIITQPLWRKKLLKHNQAQDNCSSQSSCQTDDCTKCPLPSSHFQTYIDQKYGQKSKNNK